MEPRPVSTVLPEWLIRDLEEPIRERRTLRIDVGYREGVVLDTTRHDERRGAPMRLDGYPEEVRCPRGGCCSILDVLDSGRRFLCPRCGVVWLEKELRRAGVQEAVRGG